MTNNADIGVTLGYTPAQYHIFFEMPETDKYILIPKGRRFGATRGSAQFCIERLLDGLSILWVDTVQANLDQYINTYFLPVLKQLRIAHTEYSYNSSKHELTIYGATLFMRSAERPENLEGFGYNLMVLNEAGIIFSGQRGRNLWYNTLYPMVLDFEPTVFFLGTPKGKRAKKNELSETGNSLYYELCCKGGLEGEKQPKWACKTYTSYDNPMLSADLITELEDDVPFVIRAQEIHGKFLDKGEEEVFKAEWFHTQATLEQFSIIRTIISMDTAFKKGSENDHTAIVVISEARNGYVIEDCINERLEYPDLVRKTKQIFEKYPNTCNILIEDKASGTSLIQHLDNEVSAPIIPVNPTTDKNTRMAVESPIIEAGQVYLPEAGSQPWLFTFEEEIRAFPNSARKDQVDMLSQFLGWARERTNRIEIY